MKIEEINSKYESLVELLEKISISIDMSKEKQNNIDIKTEELYNETRPMMIEKMKEEREVAIREKEEFDEMTKNAVINAKKQLLGIREQSERDYQAVLLEYAKKQQSIQAKLASLKKRLTEEQETQAEELAQKSLKKANDNMRESQKNYFELRGKLDNLNNKVNQYATVLGIEKDVDSVSLYVEKENKSESKIESKSEKTGEETAKKPEPKVASKGEEIEKKPEPKVASKDEEIEKKPEPKVASTGEETAKKPEPKVASTGEEIGKKPEPKIASKVEEIEKKANQKVEIKESEDLEERYKKALIDAKNIKNITCESVMILMFEVMDLLELDKDDEVKCIKVSEGIYECYEGDKSLGTIDIKETIKLYLEDGKTLEELVKETLNIFEELVMIEDMYPQITDGKITKAQKIGLLEKIREGLEIEEQAKESETKSKENDLENETEEITITNLDGEEIPEQKKSETIEDIYEDILTELRKFKELDDFNKKKIIIKTIQLTDTEVHIEDIYNILPHEIVGRIKSIIGKDSKNLGIKLDEDKTTILKDGNAIFEVATAKIDLNKFITSTKSNFEDRLLSYKDIGYLQAETTLPKEKVKKVYETFIENVDIEKENDDMDGQGGQQSIEEVIDSSINDVNNLINNFNRQIEEFDEKEYLINVSFNAKKMSYTLNINNPSIKYNGMVEYSIKDLEKSTDYKSYKKLHQDSIKENEDTYVSYMLKLASETLSDNGGMLNHLSNYRNALEGKGEKSKNITISYDVNGIFGKGYTPELSNQIMKHAEYHSERNLASIAKKTEFTKFLEKHPKLCNIYTHIVNMNGLNLFKRKNSNTIKSLPQGNNNSRDNRNNLDINSNMNFREKYEFKKKKLKNKAKSVGYSIKDGYDKTITFAKEQKKNINDKIEKKKQQYLYEHINDEGYLL